MHLYNVRDKDGNTVEVPAKDLAFRPSIYGIVIKGDHVLLVPQFGDGYDFPGGGIDLGESLETALVREVKEETGLDVKMGELLHAHDDLFYFDYKKIGAHTLLLYYICTDPEGEINTDGFDEHEKEYADKAVWIPLEKIDDLKFYNPVDSPTLIRAAVEKI